MEASRGLWALIALSFSNVTGVEAGIRMGLRAINPESSIMKLLFSSLPARPVIPPQGAQFPRSAKLSHTPLTGREEDDTRWGASTQPPPPTHREWSVVETRA
jgi:hypothetical protein